MVRPYSTKHSAEMLCLKFSNFQVCVTSHAGKFITTKLIIPRRRKKSFCADKTAAICFSISEVHEKFRNCMVPACFEFRFHRVISKQYYRPRMDRWYARLMEYGSMNGLSVKRALPFNKLTSSHVAIQL